MSLYFYLSGRTACFIDENWFLKFKADDKIRCCFLSLLMQRFVELWLFFGSENVVL